MSEDRADGEMAEAAAQPRLEPQLSEQRLDEDEARERGQLAVFKTQCGQAMSLCSELRLCYSSWKAVSFGYAKCRPLLRLSDHEISFFIPSLRLAENGVLYALGEAGLLVDPELQLALDWWERQRPNRARAHRYHLDFERAMSFLDESQRSRNRELAAQARARRLRVESKRTFT